MLRYERHGDRDESDADTDTYATGDRASDRHN
jgi:hypothetical protein